MEHAHQPLVAIKETGLHDMDHVLSVSTADDGASAAGDFQPLTQAW